MSRRFLLAIGLAALLAPLAPAQPKPGDPKEETAETADGVKIRCRFYAAAKEVNNSCVILMHDYNADPDDKKADWDGLARFLATDVGLNVIRFDFRGHGKSDEIIPEKFWNEKWSWNQNKVTGYNRKPVKTKIEVKDFKPDYYPMLVNDLAAVRNVLDLKNDDRRVNARSVYLIASGSAAPLAFLFLAEEWSRQQTKPEAKGVVVTIPDIVSAHGRRQPNTEVAGKDYAGLILLSPTRTYSYEYGAQKGKNSVSAQQIKDWAIKYSKDTQGGGDIRGSMSILTLVGDKDVEGVKEANFFYTDVLTADGKKSPVLEPMKNSRMFPLKGTKEKGAELLGKNSTLKTEDLIKAFLEKIESDRKKLNPTDRKYDKPCRINLGSFGVGN